MLTQISTWMKDFTSQNTAIAEDETKLARTIAALLVEAAMADGEIDDAEYAHIRHMLVTQLDLPPRSGDAGARAGAGKAHHRSKTTAAASRGKQNASPKHAAKPNPDSPFAVLAGLKLKK